MKKWKNARYGEYGDVFKMEEVFKNERLEEAMAQQWAGGVNDNNKSE